MTGRPACLSCSPTSPTTLRVGVGGGEGEGGGGQTSMFILLANFTSDFAGGCSPSPQSLTQARYLLPLLPSIPHPAPPLLSTPHSGPGNFGGAIFAQMSTMRMSSCM